MKMNLPNKLTMLRVILVPFFMFFAAGSHIGRGGRLAYPAFSRSNHNHFTHDEFLLKN